MIDTAKISFPTREMAQVFATCWAQYSLRGYTLSRKQPDGSAYVTLDGLKLQDCDWIEETVQILNKAHEAEVCK